MTPPKQIEIKSDGNILELRSQKKDVIVYEYVESKSKMGLMLTVTELEIEKMIKNKIAISL